MRSKVLLAFAFLLCLARGATAAKLIQRMYVFGDSYSDTGRGYVDTDGPTAIGYVAQRLNLKLVPSNATGLYNLSLNFAVSGASTGEGPGHSVPRGWLGLGMKNQVAEFVAMVQTRKIIFDPKTTIFFIAGGLNDRRLPTEEIVGNLESEIESLYAVGGRRFLVAILPEKIPPYAETGIRINPALRKIPEDLRPRLEGATIDSSNWGFYFDTILTNASRYGFTDTQGQCAGRAIFNEDPTPCASPSTHFYYHKSHPSTAVNKLVGDMLYDEIMHRDVKMHVDSFTGPVTQDELESFIQYISTLQPDPDNRANHWSYGPSGQAVRAMGLVYEFSPDIRILNHMVRFCDAALAARNDIAPSPIGQHMIWTGRIDPAWPNSLDKEPLSTGGQQGDPVGALANCALSILKTPKVFKQTVPDSDRHHFGSTYLERAKTYLKGADTAIDGHILKGLLDLSHQGHQYFASSSPYKGGTPVPWNQQMMFNYAFQYAAAAHLLLRDDPVRAVRYHRIVADSVAWFFSEGQRTRTDRLGRPVYDWGYALPSTAAEDATHAAMDVAGIYSSYSVQSYGITRKQMIPFANTYLDVMTISPGTFAGRVDGTSDKGHSAETYTLRSGYLFLADFRPTAYVKIIGTGLTEHEETDKIDLFSRYLWMKHRLQHKDKK